MFDPTIGAAMAVVIVGILQALGVAYLGDLTALANAIVVLIGAGVVWYQRPKLVKAPDGRGDVSATGMRR